MDGGPNQCREARRPWPTNSRLLGSVAYLSHCDLRLSVKTAHVYAAGVVDGLRQFDGDRRVDAQAITANMLERPCDVRRWILGIRWRGNLAPRRPPKGQAYVVQKIDIYCIPNCVIPDLDVFVWASEGELGSKAREACKNVRELYKAAGVRSETSKGGFLSRSARPLSLRNCA